MALDNPRNSVKDLTPALGWGRPPVALIPTALAQTLNRVNLPDWLTGLLGGASAAALTANAWNRLPQDEPLLERVTSYVLRLVANRATELHHVPVGGLISDGPASLQLARWPAKTRHALLNSRVLRDPARLANLTFGEILDFRGVAVRTALEIAALLEFFLPPDIESDSVVGTCDNSLVAVARWGERGAPLLPQTLRRALANEILPPWLVQDLHLPPNATALALDSSVWRHLDALPRRAERFLLGLLAYRTDELRELRVIDGRWPLETPPDAVPWPTRVRNALRQADLLDSSSRLERMTYGDVLALPAMGVKSVLDFAAMADVVASAQLDRVLADNMRKELMAAAEEEWADRVRADDARFRDVMPPYSGSMSELLEEALNNPEGSRANALAEALPSIRARAAEIASEPIDAALVRLLRSLGVLDRNIDIVVARFGWRAGGPLTLQQVGNEFSVTRERVRQVVSRAVERVSQTYLPQIRRAVQLLTDKAPIAAFDAARLLVDEGLSAVSIDPLSLKTAAELVGYEVTFRVDSCARVPLVLAEGMAGAGSVFSFARREAGRVGVSNVDEIHAELEVSGHEFCRDAVSRILHSSRKVQFLNDEWFWMPDIPADRNRLRNVTRRMLAVASQLPVSILRQGVRRQYRYRRVDVVPPIGVLTAFYAAHPDFVVRADGAIEPARQLDYRNVLGDVEQVFVEVLGSSPTGLMDRAELEEAVTGRGVNLSTFSVFTSYSPILDHPVINVWCLRGHQVDPAQLAALHAVTAARPRQRRALAYGWEEDGSLRLSVLVRNISSPVIGIPSSISGYVSGRRFAAITQEGTPAGFVAVGEDGTSWGYGPFMRRRGAEPGDVLTLRFDLPAESVTLSLDDEGALGDNA